MDGFHEQIVCVKFYFKSGKMLSEGFHNVKTSIWEQSHE
jgi:hypothetical protein